MRKKIFNDVLASVYALVVAGMIGKWAVNMAFNERGYEAVGGEYFIILIVFVIAYKVFEIFINLLEAEFNGSKKRRCRKSDELPDQ